MNKAKQNNKEIAKTMFSKFDIEYSEHNDGLHWKINRGDYTMDFWPTTHKWYDHSMKRKGNSVEEFLQYIGETEPEM